MEKILSHIIDYLPLFGLLALGFVIWKNAWVSKQDEGDEKMKNIDLEWYPPFNIFWKI